MEENQEQERTAPINKKLLLKIAKWVSLLLAGIVLLFTLAFTYLYFNQGKIKDAITEALNEQLATEVSVGSIAIDFFSQFPEVSVRFSNVRATEALPNPRQALFLFKGIYVRFGIWDLIDGDYTIRKLTFAEGEVNLRILPDGTNNWHFWKDTESESETEKPSIALEDVTWNDAKFRYLDESMQLRILVDVNDLKATGNFLAGELDAEVNGDLLLSDLTYEELNLADDVALNGSAHVKTNGAVTAISFTDFVINNVDLSGKGEIREDDQNWNLSSKGTALRDWLPLIPKTWRPAIDPADLSGKSNASVSILIRKNATEILAKVDLLESGLNVSKRNILLKNGRGQVVFRYAASSTKNNTALELNNINADTRSGSLALTATIDNLIAPSLKANGSFNLQVEELMGIVRPGLVEEALGQVSGEFSYAQRFSDWDELKTRALAEPKLQGKLRVRNGRIKFQNANLNLKDISADLEMRNKDLVIDRLFIRESESEFLLDGWFYNVLYMGPQRPVPTLSVRLQSKYIDLDRIMAWELPKRAANDSTYSSDRTTPMAINFNLALDVKHFNLVRFNGYNLKGEVWNEDLKIKGKQIVFEALDGTVNGNFAWSTEPTGYRFWVNSDLQKIDIHKLFMGFENFGQDWLLADNIYGTGSTQIETSMAFDKKMNFLPASLKLASDITIDNGRLVGYKPLLSLSDYVETKDLEDVRFNRLQNQITIADQIISIPQMEINSNALNLLLLGRHSFDQQIDYSIRLALADVIKKKKPKKSDLDDWIVEVETADQPYIWVHVGCTVDDPCLSLDREMLKKGVKEEWKKQGEDIKNIFKPTDPKTTPKDPTKGELIFEWEEEEPDTNKR